MSISAIESVLQQMRVTALNTGIAPTGAAPAEANGGFAAELKRSLANISIAQQSAYAQAESFEMGKPGVALNDVMVDLQKANVAFQTGLQVRNRLVGAYQEVMSLQACPKCLKAPADNQINDGLSLTVEAGPALRPKAGVHNLFSSIRSRTWRKSSTRTAFLCSRRTT